MIVKKDPTVAEYSPENKDLKIALVISNYHSDLTFGMGNACREYLIQSGVDEKNIETLVAPGSWEIPLLVKMAAGLGYDGIAAFGVIIKGETYHFEMIANEVARSLMSISLEFGVPVTLEVLAVYSLEQAKARASGEHNKGVEAAQALLAQIAQIKKIKSKFLNN